MNKNNTHTQLDVSQIHKRMFDEGNDAQRVTIVSGSVPDVKVNVDASSITNAVKDGLSNIKFSIPQQEQQTLRTIEIPVIIKEIEYKEIPVVTVVKEIEYREIKVPYETVKLVEVEKLVIATQIKTIEKSTTETKYLRILSVVLFITQLISLFFLKTK